MFNSTFKPAWKQKSKKAHRQNIPKTSSLIDRDKEDCAVLLSNFFCYYVLTPRSYVYLGLGQKNIKSQRWRLSWKRKKNSIVIFRFSLSHLAFGDSQEILQLSFWEKKIWQKNSFDSFHVIFPLLKDWLRASTQTFVGNFENVKTSYQWTYKHELFSKVEIENEDELLIEL